MLTLVVLSAVIAMQVQTIIYWRVSQTRRVICIENEGTYFPSRANAQCIKDGRIIIVWTLSGRVDNP